ncbi:MAG: tyrosinase family protein [Owenweeksia sp.]
MKLNLKIPVARLLCLTLLLGAACQNPPPAETETEADEMAEAPTQYVRKNASDPAAAADIEAMVTAFDKLKKLPCTDPVSWYYQGAIHWVPNNIPNGNPPCPEYQDSSQVMPAWMNCTHAPGSKLHFLIWHRLYIYYLERIIRKYSGKTDFALPYWDYTDVNYRTMPEAFRKEGSSIYASARLDSLNKGFPIGPFMDQNLDVTDLFENRLFSAFNSTINDAPHGAMHDYIGGAYAHINVWNEIYQQDGSGLMAEVSSAAFDPIFWLHHSNIDFLWQEWENSPNGARPKLKALEDAPWGYTFFDENGSKIELTVAEAYDMAFNKMDYTYDAFEQKQLLTSTEIMLQEDQEPEVIASSKPKRKIRESTSQFAIDLSSKKDKSLLKSDKQAHVMLLTVKVSFLKQPAHSYEVYIREQGADDKLVSKENLAGIMTFFGAEHHATAHQGHGHKHNAGDRIESSFTFDITDELDLSKFNGKLDIDIRRKGKPTDQEIVIEEIILEKVAIDQ